MQERKLKFLVDIANEHEVPLLIAGDIFHQAKSSPWLERMVIEELGKVKEKVYLVPGQHDLPNHRIDKINESSLGVLESAGIVDILSDDPVLIDENLLLYGCGWNQDIPEPEDDFCRKILIIHKLIVKDNPPFPGDTSPNAEEMIEMAFGFNLIISGDNHQSFMIEKKGKILLNPGAIKRDRIDQWDYKPAVFLLNENLGITSVPIPIEPSEQVMSKEHLTKEFDKNERIEAFVNGFKEVEMGFDFIDNLKKHLQINQIEKPVREIVWEMVEGK